MKKIILLASALVLGGTAYAQDASMQPPASGSSMPSTTPDAAAQPTGAPDMAMPSTPDATTPPAAPDGSMPAAAPGSSMPAGGSSMPMAGQSSSMPAQGAADLPMCSKTVTDSCRQGGGSGMMHHKMMHKKHK